MITDKKHTLIIYSLSVIKLKFLEQKTVYWLAVICLNKNDFLLIHPFIYLAARI